MAKRFINTEIFDDRWFMNLSLNGKVLWLYCITKCDHGGILEMNESLCSFQTGIKDLSKAMEELSDKLYEVRKGCFFIKKFIEFQYPGFPKSKVRQQEGAIKILEKYGLFDTNNQSVIKQLPNSLLRVSKDLDKSYGNDNDNGNDNGNDNDNEYKYESTKETRNVQVEKYISVWQSFKKTNEVPIEYEDIILKWLMYKDEKKQSYTKSGIQAFVKRLINESKGNSELALEIIEYSMAQGYSGVFKNANKVKKSLPTGMILKSGSDSILNKVLKNRHI